MDPKLEHLIAEADRGAHNDKDRDTQTEDFLKEQVLLTSRWIKGGLVLVTFLGFIICKATDVCNGLKGLNPASPDRCILDRGLDITLNLTLTVWSHAPMRWALKVLSSFMIDATFIATMNYV